MTFVGLLLTIGSLFVALAFANRVQERPAEKSGLTAYEDHDAYEVYSAVLPATREMSHQGSTLLIQQETQPLIPMSDCGRPSGKYVNIAPAFDQYREVNREPRLLQPKFSLNRPYALKPIRLLEMYSHPSTTLPSLTVHHLTLSAVGFNDSRTIAVFYVSDYCPGVTCSSGQLYAAQKKNGEWKPISWANECGWISQAKQ